MTILTILFTAILSALHGSGRVSKIIPTLAMMIYCTIALYSVGVGYYSFIGLIIGFLWRIVTRSGRQAHAELQAMDTRNIASNKDKILAVWKAHWFNPFALILGFLIVKWLNYNNYPYQAGDSEGKRLFDTRRLTEIASGALPQAAFVVACLTVVQAYNLQY